MITLTTTTKAKLLFVEVPDDTRDIEIHDGYITYHVGTGTDGYDILRDSVNGIHPDTHDLLFTTKRATEEDWKGVVDEDQDCDVDFETYKEVWFDVYKDYESSNKWPFFCDTATESGLSLQKANGMDVNKNYAVIKID